MSGNSKAALAGKVAVVTGASRGTGKGSTDIDGRVIPSLRAERGAPIWMPV